MLRRQRSDSAAAAERLDRGKWTLRHEIIVGADSQSLIY